MRDKVILLSVKTGRRIPPRLLEAPPEVQQGLQLYVKCFWQLASDRGENGRLSWSTIHRWCEAHRLTGDDADDVLFLVRRMDAAYVDWAQAAGKRKARDDKVKEQMGRGKSP